MQGVASIGDGPAAKLTGGNFATATRRRERVKIIVSVHK